jgi:3-hydroxyisobutyrate dehydrogenase-like beta-hydroxyacid dehydrogenase
MPRKTKTNVGIIGLGIIGSRVAENLRNGGFQVYVWNRTPKPAPNFLGTPAEVAQLCDIVQLFVADAAALFETLDAVFATLSARHTVICSATVDPGTILEAAQMVEATGAKFLEAPFTGSRGAAEKRELVYFVGGDDAVLRNVEPVLKATSRAIVKIGSLGQAAVLKIVTNILSAVTVQTLAEAVAIVKRSGIDPSALTNALEHHGVRSGIIDMKLPKILARDYDAHFSVKHMFKDVQLAIRAANGFEIDIPATTATAGALYAGINSGWADLDFSAVAKFYERPEDLPAEPEKIEAQIEEPPSEQPSETVVEAAEENPPDDEIPQEFDAQNSPPPEEKSDDAEQNADIKTEAVSDAPAISQHAPQAVAAKPDKGKGWFGRRREK